MTASSRFEKLDLFYLGREIDSETGETSPLPLLYKNKHLTTHAAILGMTGSGKTGLGVCLLEEAAIDRLPALVIDPKGDMANLLLTFPEMRPEDFMPWLEQAKAEQKGMNLDELARVTAETWAQGIASWDQDSERVDRLKSSAAFSLFTPGSTSGRPVSVLDSLDAPDQGILDDTSTAAGLVHSTVSSILGLIGLQADPLTSREHILLSSIILHTWRSGAGLKLETLISSVVSPPFDHIGVFPLESFYPQTRRMELAMQLNNILASPSFSAWMQGEPLRIDSLLYTAEGKPRVSIFSIAHLSESERMFFVTMLLGRLISWMRRQEGTDGLRCLFYMDEIFGYFPPLGNPPSKEPMLLLLKQARAYGLGIVLATQNPVDLDYKGLANIGTWFIGRLQTRQDQDKVLTGIAAGSGAFKLDRIRRLLANMRGRTFLMQSVHLDEPVLFETRWVMSYLKGPISLGEINKLIESGQEEGPKQEQDFKTGFEALTGGDLAGNPPILPDAVEQRFVPPPVPAEGMQYIPWLAGSASVRFFNQSRGINQVSPVRLKIPLDGTHDGEDWSRAEENTVPREMTAGGPPVSMRFKQLPAAISVLKSLHEQEKGFAGYLYHSMELSMKRIPALKLESRPDESDNQFQLRIADALRQKKEDEVRKLEEQFQAKQRTLENRLEKAYARIEVEKGDVKARGMDTALSFGVAVIGALFGRKAVSVTTASRSAQGVRSAGRMMKEKEDVRRAEEEVQRIESAIAELAEELQSKIAETADRYSPANYSPEPFAIKPRRNDIFDVKVYLQWEPVLDVTGMV